MRCVRRPLFTLFPYTTLFRSSGEREARLADLERDSPALAGELRRMLAADATRRGVLTAGAGALALGLPRSEEHTSELQSQANFVCRLLLAKKNLYTDPMLHLP